MRVPNPEPFQGFVISSRYKLHEQIWPASPGFGINIGGIAPKGNYPNTEAVYLLATIGENARYGNRWDGDVLVFSGEDKPGTKDAKRVDQDPEFGRNKILSNIGDLDIPVYGFSKKETEETWEYLGLMDVVGQSMVKSGGRMVVEYRLLPFQVANASGYRQAESEARSEVESAEPFSYRTTERDRGPAGTRKIRSKAFAAAVKATYGNSCAICGLSRKNAAGKFEVEAAHVYPVEKNGVDKVRNGISLCRFHHWAFDGALLIIDPDLTIHVSLWGSGIPQVAEFDSKPLAVLPEDLSKRPHPAGLEARAKLSRKGWTRNSRLETAD
jgi:putative restriction endonuclease